MTPGRKGGTNTVPVSHYISHAGLRVLKGNENIRTVAQASCSRAPFPLPYRPAEIYKVCVCWANDSRQKATRMWERPVVQMAEDTGSFVDGGVKGGLQICSRVRLDTHLTRVQVAGVDRGSVTWGFI